jgi:hypothetical protein
MLGYDLQCVIEYPKIDFVAEQRASGEVHDAQERLIRVGFDSCLGKA